MKEFFKTENLDNNTQLHTNKLQYGGFLLSRTKNHELKGIILHDNGDIAGNWYLPTDMTIPDNFILVEHKNGTMSLIAKKDAHSWAIISSPIESPITNGKLKKSDLVIM